MEVVTGIILLLGGAAGYLFFSLVLRKRTPLTIASAATCLFYLGFIFTRLFFYRAPGPEWTLFWLQLNLIFISLTALGLMFFIKTIFLHDYDGIDFQFLTGGYFLFFCFYIIDLIFVWQTRTVFLQESVVIAFTFNDYHPGPVDLALYGFIFFTFAYCGVRLFSLLKAKKFRLQAVPFTLLIIFLLFVSVDILIVFKVIPFMFYVTEPGMFFLILIISYVNSDVQSFALSNPESDNLLSEYTEQRYKLDLLAGVEVESILAKLNMIMADEKRYLDPDLSIRTVARELGVSYPVLSQLLNDRLGSDFRNFVNRFRTEEAKRLLKDQPELSVLTICYDVGFHSKSAFNNAFKKFTGQNPSDYRKTGG